MDGYRAALLRVGVVPDPVLVRHGDSLVGGGLRHGADLLALGRTARRPSSAAPTSRPTASTRPRADLGLSVPEDVSVVGFDDVELCQWVSPQLTTVRQPLADMAREATRMVIELSRDGVRPTSRLELATTVVVRQSTAPPTPGPGPTPGPAAG